MNTSPLLINEATLTDLVGINSLLKNIYYYSKDTDSRYIDCSENTAAALNLLSLKDVKGKSDEYFGWAESRIRFLRQHDLDVLECKAPICRVEKPFVASQGKKLQLMSYKAPLYINDELVGISGISFEVETVDSKNVITSSPCPSELLQYLKREFTPREADILFYLTRGKTAREIATALSISKRTVESYLENIKNKTNASTRSELIEKLIDGFICQFRTE